MKNNKTLNELISLKGKKALITGAAAGIGKAIAFRFAEAGASLELADINKEGLKELKKNLLKFRTEINIYETDISKKENIDSLWEKVKTPDILVNNAGCYPFKNFLEIDENFYRKVIGVNLDSVFWMCHQMIKRRIKKGGVIVNISSIEAFLPFAKDLVPYTVGKLGVASLTRTLAKEYACKGFKINALVPGGISTPGTKKVAKRLFGLEFGVVKEGVKFGLRLPVGRLGDPDEVARIALVLASDLSGYVQGALIPVDGGFLSN